MIRWILLLFLCRSIMTMDKLRECGQQECLLIQCYLPIVLEEFLHTAQTALKPFDEFIERQHVFISYHLCTDLPADQIEEAGACLYGVLFRFVQYDANGTLHQRVVIQSSSIQDETVAIILDMISKVLYRIESIHNNTQLEERLKTTEEEDVVVVNAQSLTPRIHFTISQIILNYGQWFTFIYNTNKSTEFNTCLYEIHSANHRQPLMECADEHTIQIKLEDRLRNQSIPIQSYQDLIAINAFPKTLPNLYLITNGSVNSVPDQFIKMIDVDISTFPSESEDIKYHDVLEGPYPFCLFWSPKRKRLERLGDRPSLELLHELFQRETDNEEDRRNIHGMIDDEVRYLADQRTNRWPINPNVIFLKETKEFERLKKAEAVLIVLYTVKWDSTSKLARQAFHQLAVPLSAVKPVRMLDIDCFDWTEICQREGIDQWPTLLVMKSQGEKQFYSGSTDRNEMLRFLIRSMVDEPYRLDDDQDIVSLQRLLTHQPIMIIAQIEHGHDSLLTDYKNLVEEFVKDERFFFIYQYSSDRSSIIIKQNRGDQNSLFQPITVTLPFPGDQTELKARLIELQRPTMIPFDPEDWVLSTKSSAIFLVSSRSELPHWQVDSVPNEAILWIDTNAPWIQLIHEYGEIRFPALIYLDMIEGNVYVNHTWKDVNSWLENIRKGAMRPFYRLMSPEEINRPSQKAIDFNKSVYNEEELDEYRLIHETSERINEHGLGFDSNGMPIEMNV